MIYLGYSVIFLHLLTLSIVLKSWASQLTLKNCLEFRRKYMCSLGMDQLIKV